MRPSNLSDKISLRTFKDGVSIYWPDYDRDPDKCYSFVMNLLSDADVGVSYCKNKRVCVQAGGHAGLWPLRLAKSFGIVHTFEAESALYECLVKNTAHVDHIKCDPRALGSKTTTVMMSPRSTAGSWRVDKMGSVETEQTSIDEMNLPLCDLIVLDIEGHEADALLGAAKTIKRFRPVIQVELLPRSKDGIELLLQQYGYKCEKKVHKDAVYISR